MKGKLIIGKPAQEIFDTVVVHLLKQGKQSIGAASSGNCAYRGDSGLMCAAGVLIDNDEYDCRYENSDWDSLVCDQGFTEEHRALIADLQGVHDGAVDTTGACSFHASVYRHALGVANDHNLNTGALERAYKEHA